MIFTVDQLINLHAIFLLGKKHSSYLPLNYKSSPTYHKDFKTVKSSLMPQKQRQSLRLSSIGKSTTLTFPSQETSFFCRNVNYIHLKTGMLSVRICPFSFFQDMLLIQVQAVSNHTQAACLVCKVPSEDCTHLNHHVAFFYCNTQSDSLSVP